MLESFRKYLSGTPKEQIRKKIEEINAMGFVSQTIDEYFKSFDSHFIQFNNKKSDD